MQTGILKEPIKGRVMLKTLNLDGDRQADLTVHGGPDKAVYAYPIEHYDFWLKILSDMELPHGLFGENFTIQGLTESEVSVGDVFEIGSSRVIATQPRMPCHKLGVKFRRVDIIKKCLASGRSGIYFRVLKDREVGTGDPIVKIRKDSNQIAISDIVRLHATDSEDIKTMRRAVRVKASLEGWKHHFLEQIRQLEKTSPKGNLDN